MIWLFTAETSNVVEPKCVYVFLLEYDSSLCVIWLFTADLECSLDNIRGKPFPMFDMTLYLYDMTLYHRNLEFCRASMCCNDV